MFNFRNKIKKLSKRYASNCTRRSLNNVLDDIKNVEDFEVMIRVFDDGNMKGVSPEVKNVISSAYSPASILPIVGTFISFGFLFISGLEHFGFYFLALGVVFLSLYLSTISHLERELAEVLTEAKKEFKRKASMHLGFSHKELSLEDIKDVINRKIKKLEKDPYE